MDFKYPHSLIFNAITETLFEEAKKGNHQVRTNELYEKSMSILNRSSKTIKRYKPSKTTFSQALKKMVEDNIVKKSVKFESASYVDFSLTEGAKVMRKLNILGISEENITFTRVYEKILLSIAFSMPNNVLCKSKLDKVLLQAKVNQSTLDVFTRNTNNMHGISIEDFIKQSDSSCYSCDVVERAFTFLEQINLIKKTLFDNDINYILADEELQKLIDAIGHVFIEELYLLTYKWRHFSQPTKEEKDRLEWIFSRDISKRIIQAAEITRYENKKVREQSKNIAEYIEYLKQGNIDEFELSLITSAFKLYNNNKIKRKNVARVRSPKKDIQEYFNVLEKRFKEIESDFVNKIENTQKEYKKTIQEYTFIFQHILNHICPMLLKQFSTRDWKSAPFASQVATRIKIMQLIESKLSHSSDMTWP